MTTTIKLTQKEAIAKLKAIGYQLKKLDGEYEVYPTGFRGSRSYFCHDLVDAIATAKLESSNNFELAVRNVAHPQFHQNHRNALILWHRHHGAQWKDKLLSAWYTGNYGFFFANRAELVDSNLQQLRNTCGYEVLNLIHA